MDHLTHFRHNAQDEFEEAERDLVVSESYDSEDFDDDWDDVYDLRANFYLNALKDRG